MRLSRGATASPTSGNVAAAFRAMQIQWSALPGTREESAAIGKLFGRTAADVVIGKDASETNLRHLNEAGDLARYRYLHFATHGYFDPEEPSLSAVVLNQVGNPPATDGLVTAAEWPSYNLKSDLIVLSGCETGEGKYVQGSGVTGLPYSLYLAGNSSLVLSLWEVSDDATKRFMVAFFERLKKGVPKATALAMTKQEFLRDPTVSHPSLWAGFVYYGE